MLYDRSRNATPVQIARLGEFKIAGVPLTVAATDAFAANAAGGGLRTRSSVNEMRIFVTCNRNRTSPSCTGEIGHNAIAFTVLESEAQDSGKPLELDPSVFV